MSEMERNDSIHLRWLAMLYIVLCLGAHFGDEDELPLEEQLLEVSRFQISCAQSS